MNENMVQEICLIAPTSKLAQNAKRIIDFNKYEIGVFESALEEAMHLTDTLIKKGAKIIISRKGTKEFIKTNFDIKVVGIDTLLSDYMDIFNYAKSIQGPIGFFTFAEITNGVKTICQLLNLDARYYRFRNERESEECVIKALQDGIKLGIGGVTTEKYAKKYNLNHLLTENSEESIQSAIKTALQLLQVMNDDQKKQEELKIKIQRYETILNYTHDGIIAVDNSGTITAFNRVAEKLINKKQKIYVGKKIEAIIPNTGLYDILKSGQTEIDVIMNVNGTLVNANRIPIIVDRKIQGVVASIQDINVIQNTEKKIRVKMTEKGLVAKYHFRDILGNTNVIINTIKNAKSFAYHDTTVLIIGETGTGKELFAQSIHNESKRKNNPFVAINCATLSRSLLESELFGYVEGAFTGANKGGKAGLFELAHGGTIFLDEITELPVDIQGQLLRVLQEKEIRRIGSDSVTPVDIRVIAATNKELEIEVKENRFREDLYYRLNILNLFSPPLRERKEDAKIISLSMLSKLMGEEYKEYKYHLVEILDDIYEYNWPGNIRELNNFVERFSALIREYDVFEIKSIVNKSYVNNRVIINTKETNFKTTKENHDISEVDTVNLSGWEYDIIIHSLKKNKLVVTKTAEELGISRSTLIRKMKKYKIKI